MPHTTIAAPPSQQATRQNQIAAAKQLRGKNSRSAAETKQLVDALIALLPADVAAQVLAT